MSDRSTRTTIEDFNDAFNRHDADALAALLTDDTVFEVQVGHKNRAYQTRYSFRGNLHQADRHGMRLVALVERAFGARHRRQEAQRLVVPDHLGRYAREAGRLADVHWTA